MYACVLRLDTDQGTFYTVQIGHPHPPNRPKPSGLEHQPEPDGSESRQEFGPTLRWTTQLRELRLSSGQRTSSEADSAAGLAICEFAKRA